MEVVVVRNQATRKVAFMEAPRQFLEALLLLSRCKVSELLLLLRDELSDAASGEPPCPFIHVIKCKGLVRNEHELVYDTRPPTLDAISEKLKKVIDPNEGPKGIVKAHTISFSSSKPDDVSTPAKSEAEPRALLESIEEAAREASPARKGRLFSTSEIEEVNEGQSQNGELVILEDNKAAEAREEANEKENPSPGARAKTTPTSKATPKQGSPLAQGRPKLGEASRTPLKQSPGAHRTPPVKSNSPASTRIPASRSTPNGRATPGARVPGSAPRATSTRSGDGPNTRSPWKGGGATNSTSSRLVESARPSVSRSRSAYTPPKPGARGGVGAHRAGTPSGHGEGGRAKPPPSQQQSLLSQHSEQGGGQTSELTLSSFKVCGFHPVANRHVLFPGDCKACPVCDKWYKRADAGERPCMPHQARFFPAWQGQSQLDVTLPVYHCTDHRCNTFSNARGERCLGCWDGVMGLNAGVLDHAGNIQAISYPTTAPAKPGILVHSRARCVLAQRDMLARSEQIAAACDKLSVANPVKQEVLLDRAVYLCWSCTNYLTNIPNDFCPYCVARSGKATLVCTTVTGTDTGAVMWHPWTLSKEELQSKMNPVMSGTAANKQGFMITDTLEIHAPQPLSQSVDLLKTCGIFSFDDMETQHVKIGRREVLMIARLALAPGCSSVLTQSIPDLDSHSSGILGSAS